MENMSVNICWIFLIKWKEWHCVNNSEILKKLSIFCFKILPKFQPNSINLRSKISWFIMTFFFVFFTSPEFWIKFWRQKIQFFPTCLKRLISAQLIQFIWFKKIRKIVSDSFEWYAGCVFVDFFFLFPTSDFQFTKFCMYVVYS